MDLIIRQVEAYEIDSVVTFLVEQFEKSFEFLHIESEKLAKIFSQAMRYEQCFIAMDEEKILGMITYSTYTHASFEISLKEVKLKVGWPKALRFYWNIMREGSNLKSDQICLNTLAVHSMFRHRGIATQLIQFVINETKAQEYFLEVLNTNQEALMLYTKLGFKMIKNRRQYGIYKRGNNEKIMMKLSYNWI